MVTEMVMTVWIRLVQGSEKVTDQDVDEVHGKSEGVYHKLLTPTNDMQKTKSKQIHVTDYNKKYYIYIF